MAFNGTIIGLLRKVDLTPVMNAAMKAQATADNARQMVLNRDRTLADLDADTATLGDAIAAAGTEHATMQAEWEAGDTTLLGLIENIELTPGPPGADSTVPGPPGKDSTVPGPPGNDSTVPGPPGKDSTVPGPPGKDSTVPGPPGKDSTVPGPPGKDSTVPGPPGKDATATTIGLASGKFDMSATLVAGAVSDVVVPLNLNMGTSSYAATATLIGGAGLLGKLVLDGILSQTATTVTVRVRNTGLIGLATSGAVVSVVALKLT